MTGRRCVLQPEQKDLFARDFCQHRGIITIINIIIIIIIIINYAAS